MSPAGRPLSANPKHLSVRIRLTEEDQDRLEYSAMALGLSKSEVIRKGIGAMYREAANSSGTVDVNNIFGSAYKSTYEETYSRILDELEDSGLPSEIILARAVQGAQNKAHEEAERAANNYLNKK